jgi:PadR family transcriptional regulator AphA
MSGYELKQISEKTINYFWQYSHSQIYPALKKLQAQGMVQKTPEFVGEKAKFIYSITNKGTKTLKKWLLDPYTEEEKRMPFLLKIFFHGNDEQVAGMHYQKYLADNEWKIKGLRALQQEFDQQLKKEKQPFINGWLDTVDFGIAITQAKISWTKKKIKALENG